MPGPYSAGIIDVYQNASSVQWWDYRCAPPCMVYTVLGLQMCISMHGLHSGLDSKCFPPCLFFIMLVLQMCTTIPALYDAGMKPRVTIPDKHSTHGHTHFLRHYYLSQFELTATLLLQRYECSDAPTTASGSLAVSRPQVLSGRVCMGVPRHSSDVVRGNGHGPWWEWLPNAVVMFFSWSCFPSLRNILSCEVVVINISMFSGSEGKGTGLPYSSQVLSSGFPSQQEHTLGECCVQPTVVSPICSQRPHCSGRNLIIIIFYY